MEKELRRSMSVLWKRRHIAIVWNSETLKCSCALNTTTLDLLHADAVTTCECIGVPTISQGRAMQCVDSMPAQLFAGWNNRSRFKKHASTNDNPAAATIGPQALSRA